MRDKLNKKVYIQLDENEGESTRQLEVLIPVSGKDILRLLLKRDKISNFCDTWRINWERGIKINFNKNQAKTLKKYCEVYLNEV